MGFIDDLSGLADIPSQLEPTRRLDFDHAAGVTAAADRGWITADDAADILG